MVRKKSVPGRILGGCNNVTLLRDNCVLIFDFLRSTADSVYYATRLRGAFNEKARNELIFQPRPLEWLDKS